MDNTGPAGTLHTDKIARALLQHRNCPDPTTGLSPAQIIFGRVLKDHLAIKPGAFPVRQEWRLEADLREKALARRHLLKHEQLSHRTKLLPPLAVGDLVMVQDQAANKQPGKWTKTGKVVEIQEFDSYLIKIDGSNNVTKRNRKFLRRIVPVINAVDPLQTPPPTFSTKPSTNSTPPSQSPAPSTRATPPGQTPGPSPSSPPAPTTPSPTPKPSTTTTSKPTPRKPIKERWIVTKKLPVTSTPPNSDEEPRDDAVPNQTEVVSDDNHVDVPAENTAATSTNIVSSTPIPFRIYPKPPGTKHDYEEMTRDAARARAEVSRGRI